MTVADLKKSLASMPKDAVVVLAVEVETDTGDDAYTVETSAETVTLRLDNKVQIGDHAN